MGWLGNFGWQETLLMLAVWLLLKRYGPGVRRSVPSRHSSKPTVPKRSLQGLDPDKAQVQSPCVGCGVMRFVTLTATRLEGPPWRVWWSCAECGTDSYADCPPQFAVAMMGLDRAGGTSLSKRELKGFRRVSVRDVNRAIAEELL